MWLKLLTCLLIFKLLLIQCTISKQTVTNNYFQTVGDYWKKLLNYKKCGVLSYSTGMMGTIPIGITVLDNGEIGRNISFSLVIIESGCEVKKCQSVISNSTCTNLGKESSLLLNETTFIECTCTNLDLASVHQEKKYNRNYTGVVFSPYDKNWFKENDQLSVSKWNNYTMDEIEIMLTVLASKFSLMATYETGATTPYANWTQGNSTGFVPIAAAHVNLKLSRYKLPTLKLLQGIYYNQIDGIFRREIENAFNTSESANKLFPSTVQGLIFTSDLVKDNKSAGDVIEKIYEYKNRAVESKLLIGVRMYLCQDIIPRKLPEADNDLHSVPKNFTYTEFSTPELEGLFRLLLPHVDFIICSYSPPQKLSTEDLQNVVQEHGANFLKIQRILKWVKPDIRIIGQTGWPIYGTSNNNNKNNLQNMIEYWNSMNDWAEENHFELTFFEAFDFLIDLNDPNNFAPNGPYGEEGHYGWWRRFDERSVLGSEGQINAYSYIPKILEVMNEEIEKDNDTADRKLIGAVITVGVTVFLIVGLIIGTMFWRLRKANKNIITRSTQEIAKEFRYGMQIRNGSQEIESLSLKEPELKNKKNPDKSFIVALKFPYDRKYELCSKKFKIDENWIIGRGNFGIVYGGEIDGIQGPVAFKTLNSNGSLIELKNLLSEIKIMSYVGNNDNIVNLLGAYTAKIEQGEVYVASEYCELGNLEKYLKAQKTIPQFMLPNISQNGPAASSDYVVAHFEPEEFQNNCVPPKTISKKDFLKWAYQIACGMEHIAKKKVIHSDLACRNVLLTINETAKIADFGLSKQLYYNMQYMKANSKEELPWRWMSLESLKTLVFSIESDVWSYGILLWELYSYGDTPYPGIVGCNQEFLYELDNNNYRMESPAQCPVQMSDLMLNCWNKVPAKRPTFTELKERIYELYHMEN